MEMAERSPTARGRMDLKALLAARHYMRSVRNQEQQHQQKPNTVVYPGGKVQEDSVGRGEPELRR